jgi:hypothetical protein
MDSVGDSYANAAGLLKTNQKKGILKMKTRKLGNDNL